MQITDSSYSSKRSVWTSVYCSWTCNDSDSVGIVIMGGIKRIGQVAEFLAPIMCGVYFLITILIIVMNIQKVPSVFGSIFTSAFGKDAVFGGIVGSASCMGN